MTEAQQRVVFSRNLRKLLHKNEATQKEVADAIGVSPQTFNTWCKAIAIPRMGKVAALAQYFGVNKSDLLEEDPLPAGAMPLPTQTVKIPVLGKVAAGVPIEMVTDILGYEEIDANWQGEYFALRISGRSMEPKIADGDIVIVKKQERVENGEIAVVTVNGEDATLKKVMLSPDGIILVPFNAEYETKFYANDEILSLPVDILGKVVEARRKF